MHDKGVKCKWKVDTSNEKLWNTKVISYSEKAFWGNGM